MVKFYTAKEQALMDILKAHPNSTISEMKMHIGSQNRNNVSYALNGLRVKGVLQHTDEKPPRYSLSDHQ
jgi:SOS-response transcriptional repressor LexA